MCEEELIDVLKSLVEGQFKGNDWHQLLEDNETIFGSFLSKGSLLRLKFHPLAEAKSILEQRHVAFVASDSLEWLDIDSHANKCRMCGETIVRNKGGWAWCPKGCFQLMV